jgi:hypothetical protein
MLPTTVAGLRRPLLLEVVVPGREDPQPAEKERGLPSNMSVAQRQVEGLDRQGQTAMDRSSGGEPWSATRSHDRISLEAVADRSQAAAVTTPRDRAVHFQLMSDGRILSQDASEAGWRSTGSTLRRAITENGLDRWISTNDFEVAR